MKIAKQKVFDHYEAYPLVHLTSNNSLERIKTSTLLGSLIPLPKNVEKILDVGCGASAVMERFANKYWHKNITAVDFSSKSLVSARKLAKAKFIKANAVKLPFKNKDFDLVLCNGVLHHILDYESAFSQLARVLRKDGLLYLTIYNHRHVYKLFYSLFSPLRRINSRFLINVLSIIYWPFYSLLSFLEIGSFGLFTEAKADFADRFLHPLVLFFSIEKIIKLIKKNDLSLVKSDLHALGTMRSFLLKKEI